MHPSTNPATDPATPATPPAVTLQDVLLCVAGLHDLYRQAGILGDGELAGLKRKIVRLSIRQRRHQLRFWSTEARLPVRVALAARDALASLDLSYPPV